MIISESYRALRVEIIPCPDANMVLIISSREKPSLIDAINKAKKISGVNKQSWIEKDGEPAHLPNLTRIQKKKV